MQSGHLAIGNLAFAQAIAVAVRALPGVAELSPGRSVEVATYGAHKKILGVIVRTADGALEVDVHVCAQYATSLDLTELALRIREATIQSLEVAGATRVRRIDVAFDDVRLEKEPPGGPV
jgi:uncharacterized alkaline shock family protein YloU